LPDQIIQIVICLQDHATTASAIAAAGPTFRDISFAMERHCAFSTVPRPSVDFDLINKHSSKFKHSGTQMAI
jgi:hypothetical protein